MSDALKKNIIITGIPRSGTTLVTALIDSMPDSVALNEPRWQYDWVDKNKATSAAEDFAKWLVGDFEVTRQHLIKGIPVQERRMTDGSAVTNYYRPDPEKKKVGETFSLIPFTRDGLSNNCTLAIKHNGLYLGALKQIIDTGAFTIIAIVRHPLGVISSWNNVPIPLGQGKMPGAILLWDQMRTLTQSNMDLLEKQVRMYDLVCKRLYNLREHIHIVKYEELVANKEMLASIVGKKANLPLNTIKKRDVSFYENNTQVIEEKLRQVGQYYKMFYED
jgi:hypothetical protein